MQNSVEIVRGRGMLVKNAKCACGRIECEAVAQFYVSAVSAIFVLFRAYSALSERRQGGSFLSQTRDTLVQCFSLSFPQHFQIHFSAFFHRIFSQVVRRARTDDNSLVFMLRKRTQKSALIYRPQAFIQGLSPNSRVIQIAIDRFTSPHHL